MGADSASSFVVRRGAAVLFALAMIFLLPGNSLLPLLDRDEPRFARATVEMMERGEWVVPYFNNEYRFDKPVLTYWLMRASYAVFGVNEFGARFHSVIAAALLGVVIFFMGRRWYGAGAGFLAGFGMLTCFQMAIHGRSAVADMPMVLFVCMAMWALWELLQKFSWRWFWIFYASLGFGFLAKGPIALIVPLLSALLWRFVFWRRPAAWRNLKLHFGIPIVLAIAGSWGIPALVKTGGLFWKVGMGEHVVDRGLKAFNGRFPFPLYYVFTMFVSLFPWCLFIRGPWRVARGKLEGGKTELDAFLAAWFVAPVLVFSFYSTQLMHYILPGFPAFFLLLARDWASRNDEEREKSARRFLRSGLVAGAVFVALVLALGWYLRPRTPAIQLREYLASRPANTEFGFFRFREPSLVFYSGRTFQTIGKLEAAQEFIARPGPRVLIAEEWSKQVIGSKQDNRADEMGALPTNGCNVVSIEGVKIAQGRFVGVRAVFKP